MSDDQESKTEDATEKRVRDAVEKGDVPFSREAPVFASILGLLIALSLVVRDGTGPLVRDLIPFIDHPRDFALGNSQDAAMILQGTALAAARFLIPILAILGGCSLVASLVQNVPSVVGERIRPQWSRISLAKGWGRIFGKSGQVEFLKSLFKFLSVTVVALLLLRSEGNKAVNAMFSDPSQIPDLILTVAIRLVSVVSIATIVIVAADLVWSRLRWQRSIRMSKQDLKDEHKQSEGDPLVKGRLRSMAQDRSRKRMLANVKNATLVIANPTHYAIALRYARDEQPAPLVLARGKDLLALRIREIAEANGIPVVEDKLLARSLYDSVEVDQMIPAEFYSAVAQVLFFLFSKAR
ncbi:flagellar type III secretion system protein FlhB [Methylobacterium sp. WL69]|uniref:EscU/YscU/HrcU family type III secretion system export apparatus switch protein n=1 Tax=Methylobacterium sp. WL69 TaxID=2603893 RepID=UPI0011CC2745|nr:EscU/YscU/HrcU family type III secretion system export apparatus switch protein [Methylobacterium sp. WL69]TXM72297.1 flagellar type III secretion system protein FlhB [Methylobacterium sp. WL69]